MGTPVCTCGHSHGSESSLCPIIGCPCKTFMDQRDEDLRRLNLQIRVAKEALGSIVGEAGNAEEMYGVACNALAKLGETPSEWIQDERNLIAAELKEKDRLLGEAQDALKHIIGFYGPGLDGSPEEVAGKLARECLEKQGIKDFALKRVEGRQNCSHEGLPCRHCGATD